MFELTLFDHLRLTFGHVAYRHQAHARSARLRARWSRGLKAGQALLMAAIVYAASAAAAGRGPAYATATAVLASAALVVILVHLIFDMEASSRAHGAFAARLWLAREKYQAMLSDLCDGALDAASARSRRDALMEELLALYEQAPADAHAFPAAGRASGGSAALSDAEIDLFLPRSLHKIETQAAG